ncbi:MAG: CRISPR-associated endonuclease Cas6 [Nitrospirota bacterium]
MTIQQIILRLKTEPVLTDHGNALRGYIANQFPRYDILHNHREDGSLLYLYPRIQYRIIDGEGYIIGIDEGVSVIREIEPSVDRLHLKGKNFPIVQKQLISENVNFGLSDIQRDYHFIKPWLALNEQNYHEYITSGNQRKKTDMLKNILIGNLLGLAKSVGYVVDKQINVSSLTFEERECFLKGTPMLGFLGNFSVNFDIPDYWGIGKSVSRGFGTIRRCRQKQCRCQ